MESSKKNISRYCPFKGTVSLDLHSSYKSKLKSKKIIYECVPWCGGPRRGAPRTRRPRSSRPPRSRWPPSRWRLTKTQISNLILYFNFYNFICYKKIQFTYYSNIRKIICNAIRDDNFRVIIFTRHHAQVNMQMVRVFFCLLRSWNYA